MSGQQGSNASYWPRRMSSTPPRDSYCLQPVPATTTWGRAPREPALSEVEGSRPSKARQLVSYDAIRITTDEATPPENSSLKSSASKMRSALSGTGLLTRFGYSS
jgi:hypothetical protein